MFLKFAIVILSILPFTNVGGQNRIFFTANQLKINLMSSEIKSIKLPWGNFGKLLKVSYSDGCETTINRDTIWGFQRKDEQVKRIFRRRPYELVETSPIVIYKINGKGTSYYFSKDLNSEIFPLYRKKLLKIIDDEGLIKLIKGSKYL